MTFKKIKWALRFPLPAPAPANAGRRFSSTPAFHHGPTSEEALDASFSIYLDDPRNPLWWAASERVQSLTVLPESRVEQYERNLRPHQVGTAAPLYLQRPGRMPSSPTSQFLQLPDFGDGDWRANITNPIPPDSHVINWLRKGAPRVTHRDTASSHGINFLQGGLQAIYNPNVWPPLQGKLFLRPFVRVITCNSIQNW